MRINNQGTNDVLYIIVTNSSGIATVSFCKVKGVTTEYVRWTFVMLMVFNFLPKLLHNDAIEFVTNYFFVPFSRLDVQQSI